MFSAIKPKGFTLVEMIIVIIILSILFAGTLVAIGNVFGKQNVKNHGIQMVETMREAHRNAISQRLDAPWGIKFDDASSPNTYTLFKGASFISRDTDYDRQIVLPTSLSIDSLSLNGGGDEMIFTQETGINNQHGSFSLSSNIEGDGTFAISVNLLGLVDYSY